MNCPQTHLQDSRMVAALRPQPIVQHKITAAPCRPMGLHWLVPVIPAALAVVLTIRDLLP